MCMDAVEAQKFIMAMTMLRSFMPGLPVFKNANEFVSALQQTNQLAGAPGATAAPAAPGAMPGLGGGGSPIAMIMKAMQIEPIPIVSAAETAKMVTTESKVFSIYATGYVRSGKRESRVRVHAVVDFRGAPSPQQQLNDLVARLGQAASGQPPGTTPPPSNTAQTDSSGSIQGGLPNVMKPGPGGNVVYYRVD
jgi:general secretion pathway protein K